MARSYRRSLGLAVFVAAAALAPAGCGGASSPHVASLATSSGNTGSPPSGSGGKRTRDGGGRPATNLAMGNPTRLVDEWAACERRHGDPNQADPIIDAHGVIDITTPPLGSGGVPAGDPHAVVGTCTNYLAAAQRALRAADPVRDPLGMDNQADLLKYVNCMRTNGVPNYPYPTGNTTNFNGTGVDPTSPRVVRISITCGNKLHLPLWWSAGWGPPGDVSVGPPLGGPRPAGLVSAAGAPPGASPPRPAGAGGNSEVGSGG